MTSKPGSSSNGHSEDTRHAKVEVAIDYAALSMKDHCPLGMYVIPSIESLLVWAGVLFVHQGYYADAILKFRLTFPPSYPDQPPIVQFTTDVFHPLIAQNDGTMNLRPRFNPWRAKHHRVFHVLHFIKTTFKKHELDLISEHECLNKEAYRYHDSTSSFAALATQSAMLSQSASALFDRDHPSMSGRYHDIVFHEVQDEDLENLREKLGLQSWN
ncbi:UBC-like protein [Rickenella mellea]|uniref:UBC-like protein n=1 Tax=Rickenella mellea TaxID=50990 RepID=A0A4Y7QLU6_9AGAM|nr:UBC-like protein [Rickenella mellea]